MKAGSEVEFKEKQASLDLTNPPWTAHFLMALIPCSATRQDLYLRTCK